MYKFTNGLVFFDKKSADECIKAGYKLIEEEQPKEIKDEVNADIGLIDNTNKQSKEQSRKH